MKKIFYYDDVGVFRHSYAFSPLPIIPAAIGAAAVIGSGIMSMMNNQSNREEQRRVNAENMNFQREMFNKRVARENYLNANSALLQRQSLESAGMNPNIGSYGQLQTGISQGSPSSAASVNQNPFDGAAAGALASLVQQQPLVDAEVEKKKAETEETRSRIPQNEADTLLKQAQAFNIQTLTEPQRKKLEEEVANVREATENLKVERAETTEKINLLLGQTEGQRLSNELLQQETPLILQKYAGEIANLWSQKRLNDAQAVAAYKSLSVMTAQINELNSRAKLNDAQRIYVANLAFGVALDNQFKPFEKATGLEFTDSQIQEIKETIGKIQQDKDWAPFNNIFGAFSAPMGAAAGAYFGSRAKGTAVSGISLPVNSTWTK